MKNNTRQKCFYQMERELLHVDDFADACVFLSKLDGRPQKLLDISQIKELGWKLNIALKDGIRSVYEWHLEMMN